MKKYIFTTALSILALMTVPSTYAQQNWIVGGQQASEGQLPFVADLRYFDSYHFCGGALIAPQWIITAGHCMEDQFGNDGQVVAPTNVSVRFNSINTTGSLNANGGVKVDAEKIFVHPKYNFLTATITGGNDIALIKLRTPVTTIPAIPMAKYVDSATVYTTNTPVLIAGWGLETGSPQFQSSDILKYCITKVYSRSICRSLYGPFSDNVFCAGYSTGEPENGAGQGDSGGPVWIEENGNRKLIGIVSGGLEEITRENEPSLYTKVANYQNWIDSVINANGGYLSTNDIAKQSNIETSISSSMLQVQFLENIDATVYVRIYDAIGREVYQGSLERPTNGTTQQIPITSYSNGIYFLKLFSSNQQLNYDRKFIIQQ